MREFRIALLGAWRREPAGKHRSERLCKGRSWKIKDLHTTHIHVHILNLDILETTIWHLHRVECYTDLQWDFPQQMLRQVAWSNVAFPSMLPSASTKLATWATSAEAVNRSHPRCVIPRWTATCGGGLKRISGPATNDWTERAQFVFESHLRKRSKL